MALNFNLGGSTGKYWIKFADNFRGGGEGRNIWTGLTNACQGLKGNETFNELVKIEKDFNQRIKEDKANIERVDNQCR